MKNSLTYPADYVTEHGVCDFVMHVRKFAESDCYLRYVRPPVRMEQLGFNWTDFGEI
jgi:hypothetical protein